jgi:competence protein ComEA
VRDAIVIAGGLAKHADGDQVARHLNLASRLTDGAKIYIPTSGELLAAEGSVGDSTGLILGTEAEAQVNINTASESELDALPGIGEVTTEKIISNRPYSRIEELLEKKIVGKKVFEDIQEKVRVD